MSVDCLKNVKNDKLFDFHIYFWHGICYNNLDVQKVKMPSLKTVYKIPLISIRILTTSSIFGRHFLPECDTGGNIFRKLAEKSEHVNNY